MPHNKFSAYFKEAKTGRKGAQKQRSSGRIKEIYFDQVAL
jgi:hypothetical protein